jgi:hypothetical protein
MDWEIAYSESASSGPFTPVARVCAESWWDAEMALFEATDGVLGFGFYEVRSTGSPGARIYSWIGDGQFQLMAPETGNDAELQPSPPSSSSANARPTLSSNGSAEI